jgi:hypothetical protein
MSMGTRRGYESWQTPAPQQRPLHLPLERPEVQRDDEHRRRRRPDKTGSHVIVIDID